MVAAVAPTAISLINGVALGMLLFLMAIGLSVVFGLMNVLNLAHGSVYLAGAYVGFTVVEANGAGPLTFAMALLLAGLTGFALGALLAGLTEALGRSGHLEQAVLTLGLSMIIAELAGVVFGHDVHTLAAPNPLDGGVSILGTAYPAYRLFVIAVGALVVTALHLLVERTRLGALIRATVADRAMVETQGVDTRWLGRGVFAAAGLLAAVAGVLGGPVLGVRPGLDLQVLVLALAVVVIGGMGSVAGTLIGALLVGQVQTLGVSLFADGAAFLLFGLLAVVLLVRPGGLVGLRA